MKFDFSAAWNDALALLQRHQSVLLPILGVFIFLPAMVIGYLVPQPQPSPDADFEAMMEVWQVYWADNFLWFALSGIVSTIGSLALLALFLRPENLSVGDAIKLGVFAFLPVLLASILFGLAVGLGLLLLIIPGLYLFARLFLYQPLAAAEAIRNPLTLLTRSWELTKGNGWRILGFFVVLFIVAMILFAVISMVLGLIFLTLIGGDIGEFLMLLIATALSTALQVLFLAVYAAIYRQLAGPTASGVAQTFE